MSNITRKTKCSHISWHDFERLNKNKVFLRGLSALVGFELLRKNHWGGGGRHISYINCIEKKYSQNHRFRKTIQSPANAKLFLAQTQFIKHSST